MADVDRLYDLMKDGFDGVHSRLDELNGRTRTNERDIAVLQDRGVRVKDSAARWTGVIAIAGGVLTEAFKYFTGSHR